jgi:aspartyl/asparaginyl beta-hydroxylase (cupin superfamily)
VRTPAKGVAWAVRNNDTGKIDKVFSFRWQARYYIGSIKHYNKTRYAIVKIAYIEVPNTRKGGV